RARLLAAVRPLDRRLRAFTARGLVRTRATGSHRPGRIPATVRLPGTVRTKLQCPAGTPGLSGRAATPGRCQPAAHAGRTCPDADGRAGRQRTAATPGEERPAPAAQGRPATQGTGGGEVRHDRAHPAAPPAAGRHQLSADSRRTAPGA